MYRVVIVNLASGRTILDLKIPEDPIEALEEASEAGGISLQEWFTRAFDRARLKDPATKTTH